MRRLMLLRHAKSDWATPGLRDHDRALSPRGREAAAKMGTYLVRHALVPAFEQAPKIVSEAAVYEAGASALLGIVKETPRAVHGLLMVGHNPGFAEFAALLIASGEVEARQRLLEKFPTGALAVIDFPLDDWGKLHPRAGRLDRFVVPRTLDTATD